MRPLWVVIGRASRPFPHSKPDVRLSPHPAFQIKPSYSKRADQTRCLCVPGTHQKARLPGPRPICNFPVRSVDSCFDATAGSPFTMRPVTPRLSPGGPSPCLSHYRTAFGYYAASDIRPARWHFRAPGTHVPAGKAAEDFPHSAGTDGRTRSCLLHAGWLVTTRLTFGNQTPSSVPFWSRCVSRLHLFFVTTLTRRFLTSA